jgi:hypothetical protein
MNLDIKVGNPSTDADLLQILEIQSLNLAKGLSREEILSQGFVTVVHDFDTLKKMNDACPHIVTRDGNNIIGYALVMLPAFSGDIEILKPMFEKFETVLYNGKYLDEYKNFVMGQICVHKPYRGMGVFDLLYAGMKEQMQNSYELCVTVVASRNQRSLNAHYRAGFKNALHYTSPDGEEWELIVWDWK